MQKIKSTSTSSGYVSKLRRVDFVTLGITSVITVSSCMEIIGIYKARKNTFILGFFLLLLGWFFLKNHCHYDTGCIFQWYPKIMQTVVETRIVASCCPFPAELCCLCSFTQAHSFQTSVLLILEMRYMYQMQKDVSFITCCSCLSVSKLKAGKQIVQNVVKWLTLSSQTVNFTVIGND